VWGLAVGTLVWFYVLLPAGIAQQPQWMQHGPLGWHWLTPDGFMGLDDWSRLGRAVMLSLVANVLTMLAVANTRYGRRRWTAGVSNVGVVELRALAERFLPHERVERVFAGMHAQGPAGNARAAEVEHELAAVIGAASARLLLEVVYRQGRAEFDTVAAIVGEAAQDLHFSQRVLEAALENMSQGICVVDSDLCLVAWNRRYTTLFGYPSELLQVGRPVADLIRRNIAAGIIGPGDVEARVRRRLAHMRAGTELLSERRFPDGTVVEIRGHPMPGGGYVATFTDVTAFRETENELTLANETLELRVAERTRELAQATSEAQRANEAKSHFLAAVSHDLMQPLHAAQLFAHALAERGYDAPSARHLNDSLSATEGLLAGLLDIARLEGGRLHPQPRDFPLAEVLEPLVAEFRALARDRGVRLSVVDSRAWVCSDPLLLRRVLQNFLSNALRYSERGRVLLGVRRQGAGLRLEVWDTGPGIAEEERSVIFEEFRRGSTAGGQGLGLGLSIAQRVAALLDHPIGLRSWPGEGSVFHVDVPRATSAYHASAPSTADVYPLPPGRALILDNEPAALAALGALLGSWGWEVHAAAHAAHALNAPWRPDLCVLDYHLDRGQTGLDVLVELRREHPGVQAVMLTADRDGELRQRLMEAGVVVLYKPLKPLAMRQVMQRVVAARH
jgi:PAS domain S-box-containing protein